MMLFCESLHGHYFCAIYHESKCHIGELTQHESPATLELVTWKHGERAHSNRLAVDDATGRTDLVMIVEQAQDARRRYFADVHKRFGPPR